MLDTNTQKIQKDKKLLQILELVCDNVITLSEAQEYLNVEIHTLVGISVVEHTTFKGEYK